MGLSTRKNALRNANGVHVIANTSRILFISCIH